MLKSLKANAHTKGIDQAFSDTYKAKTNIQESLIENKLLSTNTAHNRPTDVNHTFSKLFSQLFAHRNTVTFKFFMATVHHANQENA